MGARPHTHRMGTVSASLPPCPSRLASPVTHPPTQPTHPTPPYVLHVGVDAPLSQLFRCDHAAQAAQRGRWAGAWVRRVV
jgi:hypothetical protein